MKKAIKLIYPDCTKLMCYFHVLLNVRKHINLVPKKSQTKVLVCIKNLHECTNRQKFINLRNYLDKKWSDSSLKRFGDYFFKQWIYSSDSDWQVFCSPTGISTTNNPCESHNKKVKEHFTLHVLLCRFLLFSLFA